MRRILLIVLVFIFIGSINLNGFQYMTDRDRKEIVDLKNIQPSREAIEIKLIRSFPTVEQEDTGIYLIAPDFMARDAVGNIFVTDSKQNIIYKFDSMGKYLSKIGRSGQGPGDLSLPKQIKIFDNEIVIYEAGNRRLQYFDLQGIFKKTTPIFKTYYDLVIMKDGQVIGAPLGGATQEEDLLVEVVSPEGKTVLSFGTPIKFSLGGISMNQRDIFINSKNEIILLFKKLALLQKYSMNGRLLQEKRLETEFSFLKEKINRRMNSYLPQRVGYLMSFWKMTSLEDHMYLVDYVSPRMWIWEIDEKFQITKTFWAKVDSLMVRDILLTKENNQIHFYLLGRIGDNVAKINVFVAK